VEDRALFAYPSSAGGNNDRLLEYDPEHGWLMKHQLASSSQDEISSFASKEADLYAAVRDGDDLFKIFSETAGADDGTLYAGNNFRTPWLQPAAGKMVRILRAQIEGLTVTGGTTTLKVRVYKDWDLSSYTEYDLSTDLRGGDANDQVETSIIRYSLHSRAFAFEFVAGTAVGAASVNSLSIETIMLER
jgi:hypothetical protein